MWKDVASRRSSFTSLSCVCVFSLYSLYIGILPYVGINWSSVFSACDHFNRDILIFIVSLPCTTSSTIILNNCCWLPKRNESLKEENLIFCYIWIKSSRIGSNLIWKSRSHRIDISLFVSISGVQNSIYVWGTLGEIW